MKQFDTVIVSGGSIQDGFALGFFNSLLARRKREEFLFIAADRGMEFFIRHGMLPDLVVGDFDSISPEAEKSLSLLNEDQVIRLQPMKDDSDTQHALGEALKRGASHIAVLGASGTRVDHLLANLGLLLYAKDCGAEAVLLDEWNEIRCIPKETVLSKEEVNGRHVSFFSLGGEVEGLSLEGFLYPLKGHRLSIRDCGLTVSNELAGDKAGVKYEKGDLIMILSRD